MATTDERLLPDSPVSLGVIEGRSRRFRRSEVRHWLLFTTIVLVAAGLRVYRLDAVGFNSDEAVYAGQAASIAGDPRSVPFFPIFRAHPLLFHTTVSVVFEVFGVSDLNARLTAVAFGIANVGAAYLLGREISSRRSGLLAAAIIAVMPYHVTVSRQVLLDGAQALFVALAIWALARYANGKGTTWLAAAAVLLGLSVLSKETSVILAGSAFAFFALSPGVKIGAFRAAFALATFAGVVAAYPLALRLAGAGSTGGAFLTYQLFRRPNHGFGFYPTVVPPALGWGVLLAVLAGLVITWRRFTWKDVLLWAWIAVPVVFFELFPVKGYQYLLPIATPMAVLAARALLDWPSWLRLRGRTVQRSLPVLAVVLVVVSAAVPTVQQLVSTERSTALAGTGGLPGGPDLGAWVHDNVPEGVTMMTIGPSMANIIKWYGQRNALGLSVSPNPLYRNPVYDPIVNPDLAIRSNEIQYLVWDSFSASRSTFFSEALLRYADRYSGREVYRREVDGTDDAGRAVRVPILIVYEVRP